MLEDYLMQLGLNVSANLITDILTKSYGSPQKLVEAKIAATIKVEGAEIFAAKIINFAANNGLVDIQNAYIYAPDSIAFKGNFSFGNNSISETGKTSISTGYGAFIKGTGGAQITQGDDGSIRFFV